MTKPSNNKSKLIQEPKKQKNKQLETPTQRGLSLFDHIKHIRTIQDPDYYKNLTDIDKKTFNPYMIFRGLSMDPNNLEDISSLYRYFDIIPHPQLYQLLIGLIPSNKNFYPWVKGKKKLFDTRLLTLISKYYEISQKESEEYAALLFSTEKGKKELINLVRDFGLTDKEVDDIMKGKGDDE